MKRIYILSVLLISLMSYAFAPAADAQTVPAGYELVDSIVYRPVAAVDSTLAGKDIFLMLPSEKAGDAANVKVHQSSEVLNSMRGHISSNSKRTLSG